MTSHPTEDEMVRLSQKWFRSHDDVFLACKQADPSFDDEVKTQHVYKAVRSPLAVQEQIEAGIELCQAENVAKWPFHLPFDALPADGTAANDAITGTDVAVAAFVEPNAWLYIDGISVKGIFISAPWLEVRDHCLPLVEMLYIDHRNRIVPIAFLCGAVTPANLAGFFRAVNARVDGLIAQEIGPNAFISHRFDIPVNDTVHDALLAAVPDADLRSHALQWARPAAAVVRNKESYYQIRELLRGHPVDCFAEKRVRRAILRKEVPRWQAIAAKTINPIVPELAGSLIEHDLFVISLLDTASIAETPLVMLFALTLADKMASPGEMAPILEAWRAGKDFSEPCSCPTPCGHRMPEAIRACAPDSAMFDMVNVNGSAPLDRIPRGSLHEHLSSLLKVLRYRFLDEKPESTARSAVSSISEQRLSVSFATDVSVMAAMGAFRDRTEITPSENSDTDGAEDDSDTEV